MVGYDELITFLIQTFTFIPKLKIESVLNTQITQTDYYVICCGLWLVIIVFIWFILWITFKIKDWF